MKHLCITYHMETLNEIAESCITIPIKAEIAADIMEHQEESRYVRQGSISMTPIKAILNQLAELQGYQSADFTCAQDRENRND